MLSFRYNFRFNWAYLFNQSLSTSLVRWNEIILTEYGGLILDRIPRFDQKTAEIYMKQKGTYDSFAVNPQ
jgi:hypothetical protein